MLLPLPSIWQTLSASSEGEHPSKTTGQFPVLWGKFLYNDNTTDLPTLQETARRRFSRARCSRSK